MILPSEIKTWQMPHSVGCKPSSSLLLDDRIVDLGDITDVFLSEFAEKLIDRDSIAHHYLAVNDTALDQNGGTCRQKVFEKGDLGQKDGHSDLKGGDGDDGNDGVYKRNGLVGDRERGDVREQKRADKLGHLKLAELPFPHDAHDNQKENIYDDGSDEYGCHFTLFFSLN